LIKAGIGYATAPIFSAEHGWIPLATDAFGTLSHYHRVIVRSSGITVSLVVFSYLRRPFLKLDLVRHKFAALAPMRTRFVLP
jgi:hypothetical protein|tara:strand:- start:2216 stop:2461 length:246 start_codon:yes stop_codon:yes gene_type:complete